MKEPVVCNSTCLIVLDRIAHLHLLNALFEPCAVPPKVYQESGVTAPWITVMAPTNIALVQMLNAVVDPGEAEAIALALEKGWRLIIDDRKARRWACQLGVTVMGTIAVLIQAKRAGLVPAIKPLLTAMKAVGFYISVSLEQEALLLANES
jgi:predicted nucleic acid-binding protein